MAIGTKLPLDGHSSQQPRIDGDTCTFSTLSLVSRKRIRMHQEKDGNDNGVGHKNPKHRLNCKYHPDKDQCSPCVLWSQSGSDNKLKPFHPNENSRHAGTESLALSQYATFDNIHNLNNLRYSDCVCQPCYKDFTRNCNNVENTRVKVKNEVYKQENNRKHCIFCCGTACECDQVRAMVRK